jgi:ABC-type sugar transport system ATPase subunit
MTLGDRIVVLANGGIQQVGRPIELYRAPVNRFVAGFIGSPPMNFITGRVQRDGGPAAFVADGVRLVLPSEPAVAASSSESVTLGVRPEDLTIVSGERPPAGVGVSGRVLLVERLGGTSHVHCEVGPHRLLASVSTEHLPAVGEVVELQVPPARVHLFEADGRTLAKVEPLPAPTRA